MWVVGEVTESWPRAEQEAMFPLRPLPNIQCHNAPKWVALPRQILKAPLLTTKLVHQDKEIWEIREQIKTPEKELSDEEIANLSDAEFKTLVIRMLTELVEFGHKLDEKM